jgi:hypothetical protein
MRSTKFGQRKSPPLFLVYLWYITKITAGTIKWYIAVMHLSVGICIVARSFSMIDFRPSRDASSRKIFLFQPLTCRYQAWEELSSAFVCGLLTPK